MSHQQLWWERYPGRLEYELDRLKAAGIGFERDAEAFSKGLLCLRLAPLVDGKRTNLRAVFPDLYPHFRFEVYAPELELAHHHNPLGTNLCLIGRSTDRWNTTDTLAAFLTERLPSVLRAGTEDDPTKVAETEEPQAEPFSDYYTYLPRTAVIIDSRWSIDLRHDSGALLLGLALPPSPELRGAVLEVRAEDGEVLAAAGPRLRGLYQVSTMLGRWVRTRRPLRLADPRQFFERLETMDPFREKAHSNEVAGGRLQVQAALFREEVRQWRKREDGWAFACRLETQEPRPARSRPMARGEKKWPR
jgi:hypothetical protein